MLSTLTQIETRPTGQFAGTTGRSPSTFAATLRNVRDALRDTKPSPKIVYHCRKRKKPEGWSRGASHDTSGTMGENGAHGPHTSAVLST